MDPITIALLARVLVALVLTGGLVVLAHYEMDREHEEES
jgi:hypothetical protein